MTTTQGLVLLLGAVFVVAWLQVSASLKAAALDARTRDERLRRRIKTLRKTVNAVSAATKSGPTSATQPSGVLLGHMHGAPEACMFWLSQPTHALSGGNFYWKPIESWQIADPTGKVLREIPVDVAGLEADITVRIEATAQQYSGRKSTEITSVDQRLAEDGAVQQATEEARKLLWFARPRFVRRRTAELTAQRLEDIQGRMFVVAAEHDRWREERLREEESRIRADVWTMNALQAAQTIFPVCSLRVTDCGYDLLL